MASSAELMILCAYSEARNQVDDGVAAIPRVVGNRARLAYECDGTDVGAIEKHAQFSWTEYDDPAGHYQRVAFTAAQELARIEQLLEAARRDPVQWARCARIVAAVMAGGYRGALYDHLTDDTLLYFNPDACAAPPWARPLNFVCRIGAHQFYRDSAWLAAHRRPPSAPAAAPPAISSVITRNL